ncbi:hypothetical protein GOV10_00235 [Candidatus Woesearchaeota archaeon]|nr:hypothetical protein [Candidatus Woesearchaeota archaeon]
MTRTKDKIRKDIGAEFKDKDSNILAEQPPNADIEKIMLFEEIRDLLAALVAK